MRTCLRVCRLLQSLHPGFGQFALLCGPGQGFGKRLRFACQAFGELLEVLGAEVAEGFAHGGGIAGGQGFGEGVRRGVHAGALHRLAQRVHGAHRVAGGFFLCLFLPELLQLLFRLIHGDQRVRLVPAGGEVPLQVRRQLAELGFFLFGQAGLVRLFGFLRGFGHGGGFGFQGLAGRHGPVAAAWKQKGGRAKGQEERAGQEAALWEGGADLPRVQGLQALAGVPALEEGDVGLRPG